MSKELDNFINGLLTDADLQRQAVDSPEAMNLIFNELKNLMPEGESVPLKTWMKINDALKDTLIFSPETTQNFSDEDMLTLYKNYFGNWAGLDKLGTSVIYPGVQIAFIASCTNDHQLAFDWLNSNFKIKEFDIDGLVLLRALEKRSNNILWFLSEAGEDYGMVGCLHDRVKPVIQEKFQNIKGDLPPELRDALNGLKILST